MAALPWAEILEPVLWCVALATWLIMLGAFAREAVRPLEAEHSRQLDQDLAEEAARLRVYSWQGRIDRRLRHIDRGHGRSWKRRVRSVLHRGNGESSDDQKNDAAQDKAPHDTNSYQIACGVFMNQATNRWQ